MSWAIILQTLQTELPAEDAKRIAAKIQERLAGTRITVPKKPSTQITTGAALEQHRFNIAETASHLGVSRSTVYRRMRRLVR